jgi:hypothetical protein
VSLIDPTRFGDPPAPRQHQRAPRGAGGSGAGTDHDHTAWIARCRRTAADIARVRVLARTHAGDQEWDEVDALLDRLGVALGRDLGPPGALR